MRQHSFVESFQIMAGVVSRTFFMAYSWIKHCFWRAAVGQMSITHCLVFLLALNLIYFLLCDWMISSTLAIGDARLLPLSTYILFCLWQCSRNIHSRFVRFVVRLLVFFLALQMLIRATIDGGFVPGLSVPVVVQPEAPLVISKTAA